MVDSLEKLITEHARPLAKTMLSLKSITIPEMTEAVRVYWKEARKTVSDRYSSTEFFMKLVGKEMQ